jgi:curved DNA-binding protein
MEYKDYYKILGLEKNASADDIKKNYRRLAKKYHPDVSSEKDAEEKFKEVREAYDVLKDPEKRKAYDTLGSDWKRGQHFKPPPDWQYSQNNTHAENGFAQGDFSEFFENLFRQRAHQQAGGSRHFGQRGQDAMSKVQIGLEDAFKGTERVLQIQEPDIDPQTGQMQYKTRNIKVKIPAGVIEGQHIRLSGQGGKGLGEGENGDLYLEVEISKHPFYTLHNRDIYLHLPITPWEAALGAKIEVPTLAGNVTLVIPAGSHAESKLRLKGRGMPGNPPGDQYILPKITVQKPKTETERALYEKLANEFHFDPRESLFKK